MAKKISLLEKMRKNPKNDWVIGDVETLCRQNGLILVPPSGSSHYKVYCENIAGALIVPAHRPIKPVYIRNLVSLADASNKERKAD